MPLIQPSADKLASVKALLWAGSFGRSCSLFLHNGTLQSPGTFTHPVIYSDSQVMKQGTGETVCERGTTRPRLEPEWTSGLVILGGWLANWGYTNVYSRTKQLGWRQIRCTLQKVFSWRLSQWLCYSTEIQQRWDAV